MNYSRIKNRIIARVITRFPALAVPFVRSYHPWETRDIPWTPVKKALEESVVALVTTAGVHLKHHRPFDMNDPLGDPSFRELGADVGADDLMITHDYYDHRDADADINIVFPLTRLREFAREGRIKKVCEANFSLMGHIDGHHIYTLMEITAPEIATRLNDAGADCILLTPG
ncbi:MAG: glycine/sarcosine/betaine reductase selenoprotein B family protein [Desulfomonilia bacterium]|nr:glycine/sarcosine/betaine reductase selenoprotein B family protein [Desulfomonilia bacterium]